LPNENEQISDSNSSDDDDDGNNIKEEEEDLEKAYDPIKKNYSALQIWISKRTIPPNFVDAN